MQIMTRVCFFTLACHADMCVAIRFFLLLSLKKLVRMSECCHRRPVWFRLNKIFLSSLSSLFSSVFCFLAFHMYSVISSFFSTTPVSRLLYIEKEDQSLNCPPPISFVRILKACTRHDVTQITVAVQKKKMMFVRTSVYIRDDN
jgi:hypothetical protein